MSLFLSWFASLTNKHGLRTRLALALSCLLALSAGPSFAQDEGSDVPKATGTILIGAGPVSGPNYYAAGSICAAINETQEAEGHGFRCLVQPTDGTRENLIGLQSGSLSAILMQSDWQSYIFNGDIPNLQFPGLRHLYSLQARAILVLARDGAQVRSIEELRGRRVSLGPVGTGQRVLAEAVMRVAGYAQSNFQQTLGLKPTELYNAMCGDDPSVDVAILPINIPAPLVQELILGCNVRLIPIVGPEFDRLLRDNGYLSEVVIPKAIYEGLEEDIRTLAFTSTLVTTENLPEVAGYTMTKAVFDNLDAFRAKHPLLEYLDLDRMVSVGASAPRHVGAARYFDEVGVAR